MDSSQGLRAFAKKSLAKGHLSIEPLQLVLRDAGDRRPNIGHRWFVANLLPRSLHEGTSNMSSGRLMRIGQLARRTGMAEATLRAWERRYGIPVPARTSGGHRLYSEDDAGRIARIQRLVDQGWSVHAAARKVLNEASSALDLGTVARELGDAIEAFDTPRLQQSMAELVAGASAVDAIEHVFVPLLLRFPAHGDDDMAIAAHRFAVATVASRAEQMLAERSGGTDGPVVVATLGDSSEDLSGLFAGVALADAGWDIRWLGSAIAAGPLHAACEVIKPTAIVAGSNDPLSVNRLIAEFPASDVLVLCVGHGFDGTDQRLPANFRTHRASYAQLPLAVRTAGA